MQMLEDPNGVAWVALEAFHGVLVFLVCKFRVMAFSMFFLMWLAMRVRKDRL
jgi:hypothetical protein